MRYNNQDKVKYIHFTLIHEKTMEFYELILIYLWAHNIITVYTCFLTISVNVSF